MPAGVDYELHGRTYARHRRADPRVEARIHAALGDARTVVNIGAGSGSYEPADRRVLARSGFLPAPRLGPHFTARRLDQSAPDPSRWGNWRCSIGDLELF